MDLKKKLLDNSKKVCEKESKLNDIFSQLDEQSIEIKKQYNIIEQYQRESKKANTKLEELNNTIDELQFENKITEQHKNQAIILKKKCEILENTHSDILTKKDTLIRKLKQKDDKMSEEILHLTSINT